MLFISINALQINSEKYHAVVEFLTPEDATNALSFHGKVFSGSVLKIRRPKDFIDTPVRLPVEYFFLYYGIVLSFTPIAFYNLFSMNLLIAITYLVFFSSYYYTLIVIRK